jgi:hypothetical protein
LCKCYISRCLCGSRESEIPLGSVPGRLDAQNQRTHTWGTKLAKNTHSEPNASKPIQASSKARLIHPFIKSFGQCLCCACSDRLDYSVWLNSRHIRSSRCGHIWILLELTKIFPPTHPYFVSKRGFPKQSFNIPAPVRDLEEPHPHSIMAWEVLTTPLPYPY